MCGIVGYVGDKSAAPILIDGLRRLEYRGYDSAGLAVHVDGRIEIVYTLHNMNTVQPPHRYTVAVDGLPGAEIAGEREVDVPAATLQAFNTVVRVAPDAGRQGANPIHFEIVASENADIKVREKASFLLP